MRTYAMALLFLILALPCHAVGEERAGYFLVEDCGGELTSTDGELRYYYHIPCTPDNRSWYSYYPGNHDLCPNGYTIGQFFTLGDISMGLGQPADPTDCHLLSGFRVLDFAGFACVYPEYWGWWLVEFDVYCSDESGCPIGPSLWKSEPLETCSGWNYLDIDPPLSICNCSITQRPPPSAPRILITATHVGSGGGYFPEWGTDVISTSYDSGVEMHDIGSLPALFPRPHSSHYSTMHSGYYGLDFEYCPPQWLKDPEDPTPDGTVYGYCELAWTIFLECTGPSAVETTTWGGIKSMYR